MRAPRVIAADVCCALGSRCRGIYLSTQREGAILAVDIGPHTPRTIVEVHQRLLRAIPRDDLVRVELFDSDFAFPRWVDDRAIRPSRSELEEARVRVESFVPAVEPRIVLRPRTEADDFGCVLVVESGLETAYALRAGAPDLWIAAGDTVTTQTLERGFDVVICALDWGGKLPDVLPSSFTPPPHVIWSVSANHDAQALAKTMRQIVVQRPVPVALVRSLLPEHLRRARPPEPTFVMQKPTARGSRPPRVLILERDPELRDLARRAICSVAEAHAPADEWELLDMLRHEEWELVLCDVGWQMPGFEPMHRLVRRIRPNLASRMRLLVSSTDSGDARVIRRPVTADHVRRAIP